MPLCSEPFVKCHVLGHSRTLRLWQNKTKQKEKKLPFYLNADCVWWSVFVRWGRGNGADEECSILKGRDLVTTNYG